ncbi:MAG: sulfite exporter TauE/SafE family protein [Trueperaceae bacterium]|nr:sulfite exporter TauE/SafE family protein [Trueperaceae bacterium]
MTGVAWSDLWAQTHFADPATLLAGCVAVALVGLSKGGLGGAFGLLGVPVLSLVMPPVQAAALLLPLLLMMDAVSLWAWRGYFDRATLAAMLPAAVLGIVLGWLTAAATSEALVRLLVGLVALAFVVRSVRPRRTVVAAEPRRVSAWFWGTMAGFTSFVAHAGGPPFQVHALPLRLDPKVFTGTSVIFFAVVNAVKVAPYAALGQFDARTLASAVVLLPLAVVAVRAGVAVVRRMRPTVFYPFMYAMVALVSVRLIYDGVRGLG